MLLRKKWSLVFFCVYFLITFTLMSFFFFFFFPFPFFSIEHFNYIQLTRRGDNWTISKNHQSNDLFRHSLCPISKFDDYSTRNNCSFIYCIWSLMKLFMLLLLEDLFLMLVWLPSCDWLGGHSRDLHHVIVPINFIMLTFFQSLKNHTIYSVC